MIKIEKNIYAKVIQNHIIALWDSVQMKVAYINSASYFENEKQIDDFISAFQKRKEYEEFKSFGCKQKMDISEIGNIDINQMVLLVSNACNYNCSYCQIENNLLESSMVNMSKEIAQKALNVFKNNTKDKLNRSITITGGEPLVNFEVTRFIIKTAKEMFPDIRITMFTNGALVDEQIASFLSSYDIQVLVSLDGPDWIHNETRVDKNGKGTFDLSVEGYRKLCNENCRVGISSVGGIHNQNNYHELLKLYLDLDPDSVGYNIPHFLLEKENPINLPVSDFTNILIQLYLDLRKNGIFLENISRVINSFANKKAKKTECQAQGRGFTVDARGMVGPCKSLVINDIYSVSMNDDMILSEIPIFAKWAKRSPLLFEKCLNCPACNLCGGGCAYDSYIRNNGDFMQVDERMCEYHIAVLEFLLKDLYEYTKEQVIENHFYIVQDLKQKEAFMKYFNTNKLLHRSVGHE